MHGTRRPLGSVPIVGEKHCGERASIARRTQQSCVLIPIKVSICTSTLHQCYFSDCHAIPGSTSNQRLALRTHRDVSYGDTTQPFNALYVTPGCRGQVLKAAYPGDVGLPSPVCFIDRFGPLQHRVKGKHIGGFAVDLIMCYICSSSRPVRTSRQVTVISVAPCR